MDPGNWTKSGPVFTGTATVYGVGHASFTVSPDGTEDWIEPLQGRHAAGLGSRHPDAEIRLASRRVPRLRHSRCDRIAHSGAVGSVPLTSFRNRATWATMVVVVATLVPLPTRSSPLDPPSIPLPEHPRPDFERAQWQNLNGPWQFEFDGQDVGESQRWYRTGPPTARPLVVPYPLGSPQPGQPC